jgi:Domain of unknown function (DUF4170)
MQQDCRPAQRPAAARRAIMARQLLHLVFGGELKDPNGTEFVDTARLDLVGIYPDYKSAYQAWRAKAQATVDDAQTRYFVVHLHRLLDPDATGESGPAD